jgi:hypothetical protein
MPRTLQGKAPAQSVSVRDGKRISQMAADMAYILGKERGENVEIADVMAEAFEMYRASFCANRASRMATMKASMTTICEGE